MLKLGRYWPWKTVSSHLNSTWAIAMLSAIHSPSVNSYFNVFLFFFCFLLYLWHYFSCKTEVNWQTGMERWFGYWILVTIRFCELSFKFRQLLLFIWEATSSTSQKGSELEPNCILHLFLGWLLSLCQSPIGQFFSLSLVTVPETFAKIKSVQFPCRF